MGVSPIVVMGERVLWNPKSENYVHCNVVHWYMSKAADSSGEQHAPNQDEIGFLSNGLYSNQIKKSDPNARNVQILLWTSCQVKKKKNIQANAWFSAIYKTDYSCVTQAGKKNKHQKKGTAHLSQGGPRHQLQMGWNNPYKWPKING